MILNAKDFGISQSRERFFCISQLNGTEEIEVQKKETCPSIHDFLDLNNDELIDMLLDQPVSIDVDKQIEINATKGDKLADKITAGAGSWTFIITFLLFIAF